MAKQASGQTFELDYLFDSGKDVFTAFRSLGTFYSHLHDFDRQILLQIHKDLHLEYRLENVEYGSLNTRVAQVLKNISDELLAHPQLVQLIGDLLLKSKYWLLEKLAGENEIDSKEQIEEVANKINKQIKEIGNKANLLTTFVSPFAIFRSLDEIGQEVNKLPRKEAYRFRSKVGNAILRRPTQINKPKILSELGNTSESSITTEVVKPKKIDLLGTSKWECILNGRTREMKVEDIGWLNKHHQREVDIQSGDALKVRLRTTYSYDKESKTRATYDIIEVLKVIKPDDSTQLSF